MEKETDTMYRHTSSASNTRDETLTEVQEDGMGWVNSLVESIWPELATYLETEIFYNTLEPLIQSSVSSILSGIHFERASLGAKPFTLTNPTLESAHADEVTLAFDLLYDGDSADISLSVLGASLGFRDVMFKARLGLCFSPILPESPLVGAVTVFFVDVPNVSLDLTGMANILDRAMLSKTILKIVKHQIAAFMSLPNRLVIPIAEESQVPKEKIMQIQCAPPLGVLRLRIKRASNLRNADVSFMGGKSDVYCSTRLELHKWRTSVVQNSLNPSWAEAVHPFVVSSMEQTVTIKVRDDDINGPDSLGECSFKVSDILRRSAGGEVTLPLSGKGAVSSKPAKPWSSAFAGARASAGSEPTITVCADWMGKAFRPSDTGCNLEVVQVLFLRMRPDLEPAPVTTAHAAAYEIAVKAGDFAHSLWVAQLAAEAPGGEAQDVMQGINFTVPNSAPVPIEVRVVAHPTGAKSDRSRDIGTFRIPKYEVGTTQYERLRPVEGAMSLTFCVTRWGLHSTKTLPDHSLQQVKMKLSNAFSSKSSATTWINGYLSHVWPNLAQIVQGILKQTIEPAITDALPDSVKNQLRIKFSTLLLGEEHIRLENFEVLPGLMNEVDLQADVVFESTTSDVDLRVDLVSGDKNGVSSWLGMVNPKKWLGWFSKDSSAENLENSSYFTLSAGLEDLKFRGRIGLGIRPLLTSGSLVGAVSLYFVDEPFVDMDLTGAANIMDAPLVRGAVRKAIQQVITDLMVLPNRMVFPLAEESALFGAMDLLTIENPTKEGVLKLKVLRARHVPRGDLFNSKSDPYCLVKVGAVESRTHTISDSIAPDWSDRSKQTSFVVTDMHQQVKIELYDDDSFGIDDILGTFVCSVQELVDIVRCEESSWRRKSRYEELVYSRGTLGQGASSPSQQSTTGQGKLTLLLSPAQSGEQERVQVDVECAWLIKDHAMPTTPRNSPTNAKGSSRRKLTQSPLPPAGGLVEVLVTSIYDIFMDAVDSRSQLEMSPGALDKPPAIEPCYIFIRIQLNKKGERPTDIRLSPALWLDESVATQGQLAVNKCFMFVLDSVSESEPDSITFDLISSSTGKVKGNQVQDITSVSTTSPLRFHSEKFENTEADDRSLEFESGETLEVKVRTTRLVLDSPAARAAYKSAMQDAAASDRRRRQDRYRGGGRTEDASKPGDQEPSLGADEGDLKVDGSWCSWLCSGCRGIGYSGDGLDARNDQVSLLSQK